MMLRVKAAEGLQVPKENAPRTYISAKAEDVPDTTYYRRRLATGELLLATDVTSLVPNEAARKGGKA
jgi:Protein of unknown function (DUF2635)